MVAWTTLGAFITWLTLISRPGRSQVLLYKQLRHWFINSLSDPLFPTDFLRRQAQTVRDSTSSYKIDYIIVKKNFVNHKVHQNPSSGLKVTTILLKGWILPIGGVALGRVCACSLHSRHADLLKVNYFAQNNWLKMP